MAVPEQIRTWDNRVVQCLDLEEVVLSVVTLVYKVKASIIKVRRHSVRGCSVVIARAELLEL